MPPPSQPMHVPAGLPVDQSARKEWQNVGKSNVSAVNVRQDYRGGLNKRLGYAEVYNSTTRYDGTTRTAGNRLLSHNGVILTIDGTNLDAYSEANGMAASAGRVPESSVSTQTLSSTSGDLLDVCRCGDYIATLTRVTNGFGGVVLSASVQTLSGVVVSAGKDPLYGYGVEYAQLGTYNQYILAVGINPGDVSMYAAYFDRTNVAAGWQLIPGAIAIDHFTTAGAARNLLSVSSTPGAVLFAYVNSGSTSRIGIGRLTISGSTQLTSVNTGSDVPRDICIEAGSSNAWIAWSQTAGVYVGARAVANLSSVTATSTMLVSATPDEIQSITVIGEAATTGRLMVGLHDLVIPYRESVDTAFVSFEIDAGAIDDTGDVDKLIDVMPLARPFLRDGRFYGLFSGGGDDVAILCDWTGVGKPTGNPEARDYRLRPVATTFPGLSRATTPKLHVIFRDTGMPAYGTQVIRSAEGYSVELATYDFADENRWRSATANGSLFFSGGILSYFDGRAVMEAGFLHRPRIPGDPAIGVPGPLTGDFRYVTTFEHIDDDGNWVISGVSEPVLQQAAGATLQIYVSPLVISARLAPRPDIGERTTRAAIYRTLSTGEPPYYFLAAFDTNPGQAVIFEDATLDADLSTHRLLYGTGNLPGTNGSAQDRRAPPGCVDVIEYNGMLVVATGSELWWSGQFVYGEHPWFNPAFSQPCKAMALAVQDGTLYAFEERRIFSLAGEPPSDNGIQGGLGYPRQLACDVGCTNVRSIVSTSFGIFFQSHRGIELLSRSGAVTWIGEGIQDVLASYPVVTSAVLDDPSALVRFTLAAAQGTDGRISGEGRDLVFDLTIGAWQATDDKRGATAHQASQDAAMVRYESESRYAWLGSSGVVYCEKLSTDADAYLDGATWVTAQYELPPWKLGLQQEQRIYEMELLFNRMTAAGIVIEVAEDYGGYLPVAKSWTDSELAGASQVSFRPHPQGTAIQLRARDTAPADTPYGTGQGITFVGISADIAAKQGPTRATTRLNPALRR